MPSLSPSHTHTRHTHTRTRTLTQQLILVSSAVQWQHVQRGAVLQQAGEPLQGIFFIKTGQVGCPPHPCG